MKIINSRNSYDLIILFGGLGFFTIGILILNSNPMNIAYFTFWIGIIFIIFGLISIFNLIDQMRIILRKDGIEVTSLIRKRFIKREDIIGYGYENYKGKYAQGERIRIISLGKNFKFTSSQFYNLRAVKQYLSNKPRLSTELVFKLERNSELYYSIFVILITICILLRGILGE